MTTVELQRGAADRPARRKVWLRARPILIRVLPWTVVPLLITALAWQTLALQPTPGLDPSWQAGVAMGTHYGVPFGGHLIFTYGPLGFLESTSVWFGGLGALSFLYALLTRFALALALFFGARRTFGRYAAFVIAVVVACVANNQLQETEIVLIAMVGAINLELERRRALLLAVAAGAIAGIELLLKVSIGVTLAAMTAAFVVALPGRRRDYGAAALGAFVVALVLGWLISGQDISGLPGFLGYSAQIVNGYAAAMGIAAAGVGWQAAAAVVGLAIGVWAALHSTVGAPPRRRLGTVLLWLVFWFFLFKEGFVRHDAGHAVLFFNALAAGFFAFAWRPGHRLTALACGSLLLCVALAAQGQSLTNDLRPVADVKMMVNQLRDIASRTHRQEIISAGRAQIKATDALDSRALALVRGRTVSIFPWEAALAWAYRLKWDPIPVLQSYSAYTSTLDRLDADFLNSAQAPQRIVVQQPIEIDGRILWFDQGQTSRTILCRYRQLYTAGQVAVLGLGPNRCSAPRSLGTVRAAWGQSVPVPRPPDNHSLVFARISGVDVGGLERIRALLFRPTERFIVVNGAPHRLITGTADDGVPLVSSPGVDYTAPFTVAAGARTIAVAELGQGPTSPDAITYSFYAQSFDASATGRAF